SMPGWSLAFPGLAIPTFLAYSIVHARLEPGVPRIGHSIFFGIQVNVPCASCRSTCVAQLSRRGAAYVGKQDAGRVIGSETRHKKNGCTPLRMQPLAIKRFK